MNEKIMENAETLSNTLEAIHQHTYNKCDCPTVTTCEVRQMGLLGCLAAEARLEEAKDWLVVVEAAATKPHTRRRCVEEGKQRVADLEEQAKS